MSKSSPIVDVQMDITGQKTAGWSVTTTYDPPILPSTGSGTYVSKKRIRGALVETVPSPSGWRSPTPYRSAAVRRFSFPFEYQRTGGTSSIASIKGNSIPTAGAKYGYAPNDSLFFSSLGVPSIPSNLKAQAVTEALLKLQQKRIDVGAALAELKPTVNFLATTGSRLANLIWAVRKGKFAHAAQIIAGPRGVTPKDAASAWLAWQYAIRPLMHDMYGAMAAFQKGILEQDALVNVSRTVRADSTPLFVPTGPWVRAEQAGFAEDLVKVVFYAKISDAWIASASSWGLTNPYAAAWEGLGWSFLVDWLVPVGNFLSACGATVGLTFQGGSMTTRKYAVLTYTVWPFIHSLAVGNWTTPCVCTYKCLATERVTYLDFPFPKPYVKNPFSGTHVANAAALILALSK